MNFIAHHILSWMKVRLTYWWWIVKYGGKKNIPRELIFLKMTESVSRLADNLEAARRAMPPDANQEETKTLIDIIRKVGAFRKEVEGVKRESRTSHSGE